MLATPIVLLITHTYSKGLQINDFTHDTYLRNAGRNFQHDSLGRYFNDSDGSERHSFRKERCKLVELSEEAYEIGCDYDYERQAWIVKDRYERCGHAGDDCDCYGRIHAGEKASAETIARMIREDSN